ncbi:MAG: hypothetical protein LBI62_01885 [Candidatus Accumulibacter sp.]|jgi:hypothetical protein|nr:hypothetical protein [Accumulibacter sp.]
MEPEAGHRRERQAASEETWAALKVLDFIAANKEVALFVLKDFHVFFGANHRPHDPQIVRRVRDLIPDLKQSPQPKNVIFVSPQLTFCPTTSKRTSPFSNSLCRRRRKSAKY